MNDKTFHQLVQLNKDFYENIYEEFNLTRQSPWQGWNAVVDICNKKFAGVKKTKILDLGCGNGRFFKFLYENAKFDFDYYGVDASSRLLKIAEKTIKTKYDTVKSDDFKGFQDDGVTKIQIKANKKHANSSVYFIKFDIISKISELQNIFSIYKLPRHYDIATVFGVTHHIPSNEYRKKWFLVVSNLIKEGGILAYTFWQYDNDINRFSKKFKDIAIDRYRIDKSDLDSGDYFLSFSNSDFLRYVHIYNENEKMDIRNELNNMNLIKSFKSDGKTKNLNEYFIFEKENK